MKVICVDDEEQTLRYNVSLCREMPRITETRGFADPREALAWLEGHPADLALLDINMPALDGMTLARKIRDLHPGTGIIFLTEHPQYAAEAWEIHATGYILKPLTRERLTDELSYAAEWIRKKTGGSVIPHISVQTFGNFDLLVDGKTVSFARFKAKELLAYLVDKKGIRVSRAEIFRRLWEDEEYTRPKQKMLDVVIRSLRTTLNENGIGEILQNERGMLRIVPQALDCDVYRLLAGDEQYEALYQGEYMSYYSWARLTEGHIDSELRRRRMLRRREKTDGKQNPATL